VLWSTRTWVGPAEPKAENIPSIFFLASMRAAKIRLRLEPRLHATPSVNSAAGHCPPLPLLPGRSPLVAGRRSRFSPPRRTPARRSAGICHLCRGAAMLNCARRRAAMGIPRSLNCAPPSRARRVYLLRLLLLASVTWWRDFLRPPAPPTMVVILLFPFPLAASQRPPAANGSSAFFSQGRDATIAKKIATIFLFSCYYTIFFLLLCLRRVSGGIRFCYICSRF
jgi:hypothetical protein